MPAILGVIFSLKRRVIQIRDQRGQESSIHRLRWIRDSYHPSTQGMFQHYRCLSALMYDCKLILFQQHCIAIQYCTRLNSSCGGLNYENEKLYAPLSNKDNKSLKEVKSSIKQEPGGFKLKDNPPLPKTYLVTRSYH